MKLLFFFFSLFFFSTLYAVDDQAVRKELKKGNKITLNGEQFNQDLSIQSNTIEIVENLLEVL